MVHRAESVSCKQRGDENWANVTCRSGEVRPVATRRYLGRSSVAKRYIWGRRGDLEKGRSSRWTGATKWRLSGVRKRVVTLESLQNIHVILNNNAIRSKKTFKRRRRIKRNGYERYPAIEAMSIFQFCKDVYCTFLCDFVNNVKFIKISLYTLPLKNYFTNWFTRNS